VRLLRSWPPKIPAGRSFVVDATEKLTIDGYDYAPLGDVADDVVLLEWDIAVDADGLERFVALARSDPSRVVVAPYRLYVSTNSDRPLPRGPVWAHRRADGSHVDTGEPACALFGLGMVYLPRAVVAAFLAAWKGHFSDTAFAGWHRRHVAPNVPIAWEVHAQHLHYPIAGLGLGTARLPVTQAWTSMLTRQVPADVDDAEADRAGDPQVAALLRERAGLTRRGRWDRVTAVNEQLALRGYPGKA
jgi:hypothetical protein